MCDEISELRSEIATMRVEQSELRAEIKLLSVTKLERAISDGLYSIKLVEWIVFGLCGLMLTAMITAIVGLVIAQ